MKISKSALVTILMIVFVVLDIAVLLVVFTDNGEVGFPVETVSGSALSAADVSVSDALLSAADVSGSDISPSDVVSAADEPQGPPPFSYEIYNVGDIFTFGTFEQDRNKNNGPEPIEWLVMDKNGEAVFVVSKYALEPMHYYTDERKYKYTTWEESLIRAHLNGDFYENSFTDEERSYIALTHNINSDNVDYGTPGGNPTDDYIFLLSHDEVYKYFPEMSDRRVEATPYAKARGAFVKGARTYWWLRSPGKFKCNAEYVYDGGRVYTYGSDVGHDNVCSRPAMWISFLPDE